MTIETVDFMMAPRAQGGNTSDRTNGHDNSNNSHEEMFDVLIIGSGMSGICMGAQLLMTTNDIHNFIILEKDTHVGGTWRDNIYPGAACDIPSSLYSFSFHTRSDWKEAYTSQKDMLAYIESIVDEYKLAPYILYGQCVTNATWDETKKCWTVQTAVGRQFRARHVVTAVGQLHYPRMPSIPGAADQFEGLQIHTAQWPEDLKLEDLRGKNVSVIGTGASAIQIVPEVAKVAKHLQVYQRSAHYVAPKLVGSYPAWLRALVRVFPFLNRWYRAFLVFMGEVLLQRAVFGNKLHIKIFHLLVGLNLYFAVRDAKKRDVLWPKYSFGAQRILISSTYYAALARLNVGLTANDTIASLTRTGIRTEGEEEEIPADVVIYATGFITNPFLYKMNIVGREKRRLHEDHWNSTRKEGRSRAFLGISTHGFPNFHILYGPNTNNNYTSALQFIEEQVSYVIRALKYLKSTSGGSVSLEIKREVEDEFVAELDKRSECLAYLETPNSWYLENGRVVNVWMGSVREYKERARAVEWEKEYIVA